MFNYMCAIDLDLVTLTNGTVYYSLFNTHARDIYIDKLNLQTMSTTGSGNTKCMFAIARANSTAPTGGTAVLYSKLDTESKTINVDIRRSNTGLTITGTTIDPYFTELALRTGSEGHIFEFDFNGKFVLSPGQGLIIEADGDMVTGSSLHGSVMFSTDYF